jgi:hypothetical protein
MLPRLCTIPTTDNENARKDQGYRILSKQIDKFRSDKEIFRTNFTSGDQDEDAYLYNWLIVNTRCFYYDLPMGWKPKANDDKMVLCPFMDFFNHADSGVEHHPLPINFIANYQQSHVSYNDEGYTVTSDRDYGPLNFALEMNDC